MICTKSAKKKSTQLPRETASVSSTFIKEWWTTTVRTLPPQLDKMGNYDIIIQITKQTKKHRPSASKQLNHDLVTEYGLYSAAATYSTRPKTKTNRD